MTFYDSGSIEARFLAELFDIICFINFFGLRKQTEFTQIIWTETTVFVINS